MTVNRSSNTFEEVNVGESGIAFSNVKQGEVANDVLTDSDFANWSSNDTPDDWFSEGLAGGGDADYSLLTQSEDSYAGSYALASATDGSGNGNRISNELNTYGANGETMQVRLYAKTADSATVLVYYSYEDVGMDTYYYNFTGAGAGTWTIDGGSGPTSDQIEVWAPTSSYAQNTFTQVTLPGAGVDSGWATIVVSGGNDKTVLLDNVEILIAGSDEVNNGTMEAWSTWADQNTPLASWTFEPGADWDFLPFAGDTESSSIVKGVDAHEGSNAVELVVGDSASLTSNDDRGYIWQSYSGVAATELTASVYTKTTNGKTGYMILLNGNPGSHTEIWDFVAGTWDVLGTTVTDLPGTSNALTCSGTTSYVENTADVTIPTSGNIVMVLMSDKGDGATQQTYQFDTATLSEIEAGTQIQQFPFRSTSAISDFEENDRVLDFTCNGEVGNVAYAWTLSDEGEAELDIMHESDFPGRHNFTGLDCFFGTPTNSYNPADKGYVDAQLAVRMLGFANVDYKSTGQTVIFAVPTGFVLRGFYTETKTTTAVAPNNDSVAQMGTAGGSYSDVAGAVVQPSATPGGIARGAISSTFEIATGEEIKIDVTTADTGTDLDATVYLYGVLIPV